MKLIELHFDALFDYDEISNYYEQESPNILDNFIDEFERKYDKISLTPRIFPSYRKKFRKCVTTKFPYNIIFREFEEK